MIGEDTNPVNSVFMKHKHLGDKIHIGIIILDGQNISMANISEGKTQHDAQVKKFAVRYI